MAAETPKNVTTPGSSRAADTVAGAGVAKESKASNDASSTTGLKPNMKVADEAFGNGSLVDVTPNNVASQVHGKGTPKDVKI